MISENLSVPLLSLPADPVASRARSRSPTTVLTAHDYVGAISSHATQLHEETLYPGQIYEDLSEYLKRAPIFRSSTDLENVHAACRQSHVTLNTLGLSGLSPLRTFSSASTCVKTLQKNLENEEPQILFMNGHTCAEWLVGISSTLSTDPEFLNAAMLFRSRRKYSAFPGLPSAYENNIRLRVITIGSRENVTGGGRSNSKVVESLRAEARSTMERYQHDLKIGKIRCGDSIVRDYHVLGERHFFLEQEISICMHLQDSSWTALVVSDVGNNLFLGPEGPWMQKSAKAELYPVIQHRKRIVLRTASVQHHRQDLPDNIPSQSASWLTQDYGKLLTGSAMSADPFYALHDIFRLAASSENQLLNLIEEYVNYDTNHESLNHEQPSLSNLVYCQDILETHLDRLKETKDVIRRRGGHHWPRHASDQPYFASTEAAADLLLHDFEHLEHRALSVSKKCKRGMTVILNNRMLAESKLAISQARRVTRLTFIAFIYIPLSFTTSFFGMNIKQLGVGGLPIWVWVATSVPVLVLTVLMFFLDVIVGRVPKVHQYIAAHFTAITSPALTWATSRRPKGKRIAISNAV